MLTLKMLKDMPPGTTFATGVVMDNPEGLNMCNTGMELRWVAVRGGIHDWAIYCHYADRNIEAVRRSGNKVCREGYIRMLVPCDDEAFAMYRY